MNKTTDDYDRLLMLDTNGMTEVKRDQLALERAVARSRIADLTMALEQ